MQKNNSLALKASYIYDPDGIRCQRTDSEGIETEYVHGAGGVLHLEKTAETRIRQIWFNGEVLARIITNLEGSKTYYYHNDHIGTTQKITDENGDIVWEGGTDSFGNQATENGEILGLGLYTGKDLDPASGLYYFNARWYDATLGRFITEDPARDKRTEKILIFEERKDFLSGEGSLVQGCQNRERNILTRYIYCSNNPLSFVDPTGLYDEEINSIETAIAASQEYDAHDGYQMRGDLNGPSRKVFSEAEKLFGIDRSSTQGKDVWIASGIEFMGNLSLEKPSESGGGVSAGYGVCLVNFQREGTDESFSRMYVFALKDKEGLDIDINANLSGFYAKSAFTEGTSHDYVGNSWLGYFFNTSGGVAPPGLISINFSQFEGDVRADGGKWMGYSVGVGKSAFSQGFPLSVSDSTTYYE